MPEDYEMYYGFTRFAMELNEIDGEMVKYLPCTDTRFRPDQRWVLNQWNCLNLLIHAEFVSDCWRTVI